MQVGASRLVGNDELARCIPPRGGVGSRSRGRSGGGRNDRVEKGRGSGEESRKKVEGIERG